MLKALIGPLAEFGEGLGDWILLILNANNDDVNVKMMMDDCYACGCDNLY